MGVRNDDVGNLQCNDISGAKTFKSVGLCHFDKFARLDTDTKHVAKRR